jgi:hypothetical protein
MKKIGRKPTDDQLLEGGGGGGGGGGGFTFSRITGGRAAKDHKEPKDRESELSGSMSFRGSDSGREYGGRTGRTSDDYKKGGKVSSASSRADGCCVKGKTKGRMV